VLRRPGGHDKERGITTNTPASLKYPEDSARRLLGDHLEKDRKYLDARVAAAHALIEQFRQLVDSQEVLTDKLQASRGFVVFTPAGAQVVVSVNAENGTVVAGVATGPQLPPLPCSSTRTRSSSRGKR